MITFTFTVQPGFHFLQEFGRQFGVEVFEDRLSLPEAMGEGSMRTVAFAPDFRLSIHRYTLKQDLLLRRRSPLAPNDLLSVIFYHTDLPNGLIVDKAGVVGARFHSGIQLASGDLNSDVRFPAGGEILFTVVAMRVATLRAMLQDTTDNALLSNITEAGASFYYHEPLTPEIEQLLRKLSLVNDREVLGRFYSRIIVQELLYLLFHRLAKREQEERHPVGNAETEQLFAIRQDILQDLSQPPVLAQLARKYGLSETRMKALFKQVFGDSVYNYYQRARMEEAAFLLRQSGRSVADVGYALGFNNLSHFGRLFKRYYAVNPKEYESVG